MTQEFVEWGCPGLGLHDQSLSCVDLSRARIHDTSLFNVGLSRARIHDPSLFGVGLS